MARPRREEGYYWGTPILNLRNGEEGRFSLLLFCLLPKNKYVLDSDCYFGIWPSVAVPPPVAILCASNVSGRVIDLLEGSDI